MIRVIFLQTDFFLEKGRVDVMKTSPKHGLRALTYTQYLTRNRHMSVAKSWITTDDWKNVTYAKWIRRPDCRSIYLRLFRCSDKNWMNFFSHTSTTGLWRHSRHVEHSTARTLSSLTIPMANKPIPFFSSFHICNLTFAIWYSFRFFVAFVAPSVSDVT